MCVSHTCHPSVLVKTTHDVYAPHMSRPIILICGKKLQLTPALYELLTQHERRGVSSVKLVFGRNKASRPCTYPLTKNAFSPFIIVAW